MYDVCIITTIHRDYDNRIYQRQASALIDSGLKVCMVAPWDFARRARTDFDFVQTAPVKSRAARSLHSYKTYLAALYVDSKVYIFHDPDFLPFGLLLKWRTGRDVIYDCHENIPEDIRYGKDWIPAYLRPPISAVFRFVENAIVRRLGKAIVVVPYQQRRFEALGVTVQLVRNFPRFKVPAGFSNERAVLYTGDLTRDYGVYNLVEIAREMKRRGVPIVLRIVDRFYSDDGMRAKIRGIVADEGLNVEFLDSVIAEQMPSILSRGFIGLSPIPDLPNKRIAYPTKIFEYFMFGLAVVASDIDGTREILEDGRLGILCPPSDYKAWVDAIERLLNDHVYRERHVAAAKAAVDDIYNWPHEERSLVEFVTKLARRT